jgi:hypothetical protein
MFSCFSSRKKRSPETEPLLPQYNDDTSLQRRVHQKLHSYQMIRALGKGYMPSTDQLITNLRTLLVSDVLNPETSGLTDSGRLLLKYVKQWLENFIELLKNKNNGDQIQDFICLVYHSRIPVDTSDIMRSANSIKVKADTSAG